MRTPIAPSGRPLQDAAACSEEPATEVQVWRQTLLDRDVLLQLAEEHPFGDQQPSSVRYRRRATLRLLFWLERWPGESWQDRWLASGAERLGRQWPARYREGPAEGPGSSGIL